MVKIQSAFKAPHIAARKPEVAEIVALLESDDFKTADEAARKIVSTAFRLMTERDWWAVASRLDGEPGSAVTVYGLFATEGAALKALETNSLGLFGAAAVVEIKSIAGRANHLAELEGGRVYACNQCGHPEMGHDWPRSRIPGCVVLGCGCPTFARPPREMPPVEAA